MAQRHKIGRRTDRPGNYGEYFFPEDAEIVQAEQSEVTLQQILDEPENGGPGYIVPLTRIRAEREDNPSEEQEPQLELSPS